MNAGPCTTSAADPALAPSLAGLQQLFMAQLMDRSVCEVGGSARQDNALHEIGFPRHVADGQLPAHVGLGIYSHAYTARLIEALDNDHPVLSVYLGDDLWQQMCRGYIAAFPSRHRSLRDFGAGLPHYLAHATEFCAHPEVAELAEFERHLLDSFDAADAPRATWQQLLDTPQDRWPGLRPRFHPSLKLHRAEFNSVDVWAAIKAEQVPPPVGAANSAHWALWRDEERISRYVSLTADERAGIAHSMRGGDFAGLCEMLLDWHPLEAVPSVALTQLRHWCDEGWISHWG